MADSFNAGPPVALPSDAEAMLLADHAISGVRFRPYRPLIDSAS